MPDLKRTSTLIAFLTTIVLIVLTVGYEEVPAAELNVAVQVREEYNDNVFLDERNEVDDFITTISPQIEVVEESQRLNASLTARMDSLFYADSEDLDGIDQTYTGSISYRITERWSFASQAGYTIDSRADRDIDETGLVLDTNQRNRLQLSASSTYLLSEKTTGALSLSYQQDDFEVAEGSDFDRYGTNFNLIHNLSTLFPQMFGRFNLNWSRSEYPTTTVDNFSATLGFSRQFSDLLNVVADLGARYTTTEFSNVDLDSQTWGGVGQVRISYRGELTNYSLTLSHDVSTASGISGSTVRTGLRFDMRRRLTERLSATMLARYFMNTSDESEFTTTEIDQQTFSTQLRLLYNITEDVILETAYRYTLRNDREDDEQSMGNLIYLQLLLQHSLMEF